MGPKTLAKLNELLAQVAGVPAGAAPNVFFTPAGIIERVAQGTTTPQMATTTPPLAPATPGIIATSTPGIATTSTIVTPNIPDFGAGGPGPAAGNVAAPTPAGTIASTTESTTSASPPPVFTITSPNGGEQWTTGNSYPINWTSSGTVVSTVNVELWKGGSINNTLAYNSPNGGNITWTIPSTVAGGSDYKIRIYNPTSAYYNNFDESNGMFSISVATTTASTDTSPPLISSIVATTTPDGFSVTWVTDELSDSRLQFGTTSALGAQSQFTAFVTNHWVGLSGLPSATTYYYRILSQDGAGNLATSASYSLTTGAAKPTAPTNFYAVTDGSAQSHPPTLAYHLSFYHTPDSTIKGYNIYAKRPTDADYVKYFYSANISVNPSILPLPSAGEYKLYRRGNSDWEWRMGSQTTSQFALGEYKFYVTAVNVSDAESNPTETKTFTVHPASTITNPADGSTISALSTITISPSSALSSLSSEPLGRRI